MNSNRTQSQQTFAQHIVVINSLRIGQKRPLKIRPIRQIRGKSKQTLRLCALASIEILPVEIIQIPIVDVMNPNSIIKYNSYE